MRDQTSVKIIIPSRLGSSRFPNKPLAMINDREMILHVCARASSAYPVIVATPDWQIAQLVRDSGYDAIITSKDCLTGTDRVAEVAEHVNADIYVNVQGDEPLISSTDIQRIVEIKKMMYNKVINGMSLLERIDNSQNVVKVHQHDGTLIGMTRVGEGQYKQCGLYAFNREELYQYQSLSAREKLKSLKEHESIEILRFLDLGIPVFMTLINSTPAVDVPDDIKKVMEVIRNGY